MSAAIQIPFVTEGNGWRLELFDGYATLSVDEEEIDVETVVETLFTPALRPYWSITPIRSESKWEVYLLEREATTKLA